MCIQEAYSFAKLEVETWVVVLGDGLSGFVSSGADLK